MSKENRGSVNPQLKEAFKELGVRERDYSCATDCIHRYQDLGFPFIYAVKMTLGLLEEPSIHIHRQVKSKNILMEDFMKFYEENS
jgi:hypothetical protein